MKNRIFLAAAVTWLALSSEAAVAEPIGSAVRIVNTVTGSLNQQQRNLATGDGVSQNEAIEVAADALGELKLRDDTKLALGPGARLVLDKFVYDPLPATGTVSVNLLKGAFRFITGLARKQDYQLRTPSASITVRGTIFDIFIDADGGTWLLLHEGSVQVCNTRGQCADVTNPCGVVHITAAGTVEGPQGWPAQTRQINFDTAFPFVGTPPSVDAQPLFTRAAVEQNQCAKPKTDNQRTEAPPVETPNPPRQQQAYTPPPAESYEPPQSYAPVAPVIIPPRGFSGAYGGVNVGYGLSTTDATVGCVSPAGAFSASANCYEAIVGGALVTNYDPSANGFTAGLAAGYDVRFTNVVFGFVTDMSFSDISGRDSSATAEPTFVPEYGSVKESIEWLGTVRGRLGFVTGNMLVYATGGLAYAQVETSYDLNLPTAAPPVTAGERDKGWEAGWTAGFGGEVSFGLFSISAEYLYYDLGDRTINPIAIQGGVPQPTTYFPTQFDLDGHLFRIGTNFRLN